MKPSKIISFLKKSIPSRLPVLVKGSPGIGKSDIIGQVCNGIDAELIIEYPQVSDPTEYKGFPFVSGKNKDHAEFLPFGNLKKLISANKLTVCFFDDVGQSPVAVQAALMQLILSRRVNGHSISPEVCFVAATNRHTDRAGVTGLLEPVKSRFVTILELEVDTDDWVSWALQNNLPTELIAFIRFRPALLNDFKPTNTLTNSPSPRTVHNVGKLMGMGLPRECEYEAFSGAAGEGFAAEFCGFLQIYRELPNPDTVLMNPEKAVVPESPAALYAICGALATRASENTMDRIVKYSYRIPPEFSVLLVRDSHRKDKNVVNTRAFIEWSSKNKDVLI
jgi:hypothetical protein